MKSQSQVLGGKPPKNLSLDFLYATTSKSRDNVNEILIASNDGWDKFRQNYNLADFSSYLLQS